MSRRKYILLGLLLIVAAWVCIELIANSHWFRPSPPADVRIEVSGAPGAKVDGTFEVDGVTSQRSGILPTSFSFPQARIVKFSCAGAGSDGTHGCRCPPGYEPAMDGSQLQLQVV